MGECVVCFEALNMAETIKLECSHEFHKECTEKWLREHQSCPICRKSIEFNMGVQHPLLKSCDANILRFTYSNFGIAIDYGSHLDYSNMCFSDSVARPDIFCISSAAFAQVQGDEIKIKSLFRQLELKYEQQLMHKSEFTSVRFNSLTIMGDYLYCSSPVQLLVVFIPRGKVAFQLRFDKPLVFVRWPFYLFSDGIKLLDGSVMHAFRQISISGCYKFDFCKDHFLFAYLDGRLSLTTVDGTVLCELEVGYVDKVFVVNEGFCYLQAGTLKAYSEKGDYIMQVAGVSWLEKNDASCICYSIEGNIFFLDEFN